MGAILRTCLVGLLVACLVQIPAWGLSPQPLGTVLDAEQARLDSAAAVDGATVFAGDTAETTPGGSLRLRIGAAQVYLPASSAVRLTGSASDLTGTIVRGSVGFASSGSEAIAVRAGEMTIRPQTPQPTRAQVTLVGPNELLVTSYRGPLAVELDGEVYSVAPGSTYRLLMVADSQEPQGEGAPHAKRRRKLVLLLFTLGAAAGAGILSYEGSKNRVALHPSPSVP